MIFMRNGLDLGRLHRACYHRTPPTASIRFPGEEGELGPRSYKKSNVGGLR